MAHLRCKAILAQKRHEALAAGFAVKRPSEDLNAETRAKRPRSEVASGLFAEPSEPAAEAADPPEGDPAKHAAEEAYDTARPRTCPPLLRELSGSEFRKAEATVANLHTNMGHSVRTVESALRRRKARPVLVEMSKYWKREAREEAHSLLAAPVASGWVDLPHRALGADQFEWIPPGGTVRCRATSDA